MVQIHAESSEGGVVVSTSSIAEPLRSLLVPLASLTLDPANARVHGPENVQAIKSCLTRFGQHSPIVVQKEGMVVRAGNGRVVAARELGWSEIAAVVVDESSVEATAFALADNRTAEMASWDNKQLVTLLSELSQDDVDIGQIGFTAEEFEKLVKETVPDQLNTASQLGDVQFRVVVTCDGESQQKELVDRLEGEGLKCQMLMS